GVIVGCSPCCDPLRVPRHRLRDNGVMLPESVGPAGAWRRPRRPVSPSASNIGERGRRSVEARLIDARSDGCGAGLFGGTVRLEAENERLASEANLLQSRIFASPAMSRLAVLIRRIAPRDITVLITGESGTGKERVAEALVRASSRCDRSFDCRLARCRQGKSNRRCGSAR